MPAPFAIEQAATVEMSAETLAATAGVTLQAVESFRSGVPHWSLEQPGVITAIANATGLDAQQIRAAIKAAKSRATVIRGHAGSALPFGSAYPSIRGE